jgi:FkbM family methyltransferase
MDRSPAGVIARVLVALRLDGPALELAARVLHRWPGSRVAAAVGWHLGQRARGTTRVARLRSGSRLAVDLRDYAHRHAFLFGVYEEQITALMTRVAHPGWTVVDVGANAGYHTMLASDVGRPGARVVAFEPHPEIGELLRQTLALNPGANAELVASACSDHDGSISFIPSSDPRNTGVSSVREGDPSGIAVPCVRLDGFCEERGLEPDLIKIDVEGAEAAVLRGAASLLRDNPPRHIICEVWPDSRDELFAFMAALGYEPRGIAADGALTEAPEAGTEWCDVCFIPRAAHTGRRS